MVTATGVQGSFWGPLKLQQLKISLAAADIEIDDAELDADFTQLARRRLDVARLIAARVTIALNPGTPPESPPSDEGAFMRLLLYLAIRDDRKSKCLELQSLMRTSYALFSLIIKQKRSTQYTPS